MKFNVVSLADIRKSGRWRVEIFLADERNSVSSPWPMATLGALCDAASEAIDPPRAGGNFTYVGLENVESITGDQVGVISKKIGEVKSRSKIFRRGDVLYGRLRPSLRKAFDTSEIDGGLCSTEFIVLRPNEKISAPALRAMLVSGWLSPQLEKLQIGAALPRVSAKDLLALKVPLPDAVAQKRLEQTLAKLAKERRAAKAILEGAPEALQIALTAAIS